MVMSPVEVVVAPTGGSVLGGSLAERIEGALLEFYRQAMTPMVAAAMVAHVDAVLRDAFATGELEVPAARALALLLPRTKSVQIVGRPETVEDYVALRRALPGMVLPEDLADALEGLRRQCRELDDAVASFTPTITREDFIAAVGREPVDDDLDRCNCLAAGTVGHYMCGWDLEANLPVFLAVERRR